MLLVSHLLKHRVQTFPWVWSFLLCSLSCCVHGNVSETPADEVFLYLSWLLFPTASLNVLFYVSCSHDIQGIILAVINLKHRAKDLYWLSACIQPRCLNCHQYNCLCYIYPVYMNIYILIIYLLLFGTFQNMYLL